MWFTAAAPFTFTRHIRITLPITWLGVSDATFVVLHFPPGGIVFPLCNACFILTLIFAARDVTVYLSTTFTTLFCSW